MYKQNELKRRGRLAGTKSQVFEDIMGGRENLEEIGMELLLAQLGFSPNDVRGLENHVIEQRMIIKALKDYNKPKLS